MVSFSVDYNASMSSASCGIMAIDTASIQTNAAIQSAISSVTFAGVDAAYTFGPTAFDGAIGMQIDLSGYASVTQPSTALVVTLSGSYAQQDICNVPWYSGVGCPYSLVGTASAAGSAPGACCPSAAV